MIGIGIVSNKTAQIAAAAHPYCLALALSSSWDAIARRLAIQGRPTAIGAIRGFAMPTYSFPKLRKTALTAISLSLAACAEAMAAERTVSATTIVVPAGKRGTVQIPVTVDRTKIDLSGATNPRSIKMVGQHGETIIEVLDAYPSKPQGMARCQSGTETYFRVLDTLRRKQLFARLVDSCVDDQVQAADPLITRSNDGRDVTLHGLYSSFTVKIDADGTVAVLP